MIHLANNVTTGVHVFKRELPGDIHETIAVIKKKKKRKDAHDAAIMSSEQK